MIIFDLDGTLANCEHRRHYVRHPKYIIYEYQDPSDHFPGLAGDKWQPNWDAFYEACDKDTPNQPIISLYHLMWTAGYEIAIWSGRSESVRANTNEWLFNNIPDLEYPIPLDK